MYIELYVISYLKMLLIEQIVRYNIFWRKQQKEGGSIQNGIGSWKICEFQEEIHFKRDYLIQD